VSVGCTILYTMGERPVLTARLSERTLERLEEYSDREGMSKSKAADNMIRQGLDVEESDMRLVPVRSDGGTVIEDRLDEIEQQQTQKLDEIEAALEDEPSKLEKWVYGMWTWSAGLTLAGAIAYVVSGPLGIGSINPDMAFWFTGFSAFFVLSFYVIQEAIR
jgi:hypothetical protein